MTDVDPFLIQGPAVVSFSGGRTSAYMLWRILQAHGGTLPEGVVVAFANTGREMPATLDFVRDCGAAWNVPIVWLEYRWQPGAYGFEIVNHNSASRAGEPFEMLLAAKSMLPNPVMRFCTSELKIRTMKRFVLAEMGWKRWVNIIGLRADEMGRVERSRKPKPKPERWTNLMPLADAGLGVVDVLRFWKEQPFDLRLAGPWEGNCDGCFLKSRGAIMRMQHDHPERMAWWARAETLIPSAIRPQGYNVFRADRADYAAMARDVRDQGVLPMSWLEAALPCTAGGCGI